MDDGSPLLFDKMIPDGLLGSVRDRGIDGEPTGETSQTPEQPPLCFRQQIMAPVERGAESPLPCERGAAPLGQQREAITQAHGHLRYSRGSRAARRQFDGQGDTVKAPADRGNRCEVSGARRTL